MIRIFLALLALLANGASAHDLNETSITVVLHEQHSINIVLRLDFVGLLHHVLAPEANPAEFLATAAAQAPGSLEPGISRLKQEIEQGLVLRSSGQPLTITHWQWPDTVVIHGALREQMMAGLVESDPENANVTLEVRAEAADLLAVNRLTLQLPQLLKPAVVLWYRPKQALVNQGTHEQTLEF